MSYLQTSISLPLHAGHSQDSLPHASPDNLTPLFGFGCGYRIRIVESSLQSPAAPSSPSGTWSLSCMDISSESPPSPPQPVHVICNAPLVAPIPLPYHSPTFLQFELPDVDQDLSHPPYTQRSPKRKRVRHEDVDDLTIPKRRSVTLSSYPHHRHKATRCNTYQPITPIMRPRLHCYT
jgi:hypothetical protein